MSKYGHAVKFNGKYYKPGEEVPDAVQSTKSEVEPQKKEEAKKEKPAEKKAPVGNNPDSRINQLEQTARAMERPKR